MTNTETKKIQPIKIRFTKRISGYAKVAYNKVVRECESYRILYWGDTYTFGGETRIVNSPKCLWIDGSIYELKPNTAVEIVE